MKRAVRAVRAVAALVTAAAVSVACSDRGTSAERTLVVFAAASLTDVLTDFRPNLDSDHVDVRYTFAGSSTLVRQLMDGAPAEVFVAADEPTMDAAVDAGVARSPRVIARNRMVIAVEPGNPRRIKGIADLDKPDVVTVLCAPEVPCGRLAASLLGPTGAGGFRPASLEQNVRAVVAKVELGEADAGLVYATDVRAAAGSLDSVEIQGADAPARQATYLAAVTEAADGDGDGMANAWIDALLSRAGRRRLAAHGFALP